MILYITVSVITVFLLLACTVSYFQRYEKLLVTFSFTIIWLLVSFSSFVGPDYESYKFMYDSQNDNFFLQEFLFRELGVIFKANNLSFSAFYFFLTSIYLFIIYKVFLRYRNLSALNLLIFIIMPYGLLEGGFNYLRQNVAVAFFYLSMVSLANRNLFRYLFLNGIGVLFHKSAILLLPLYFFLKIKISTTRCFLIYFIILAATMSLNLPYIKSMLLAIIGSLPGYGGVYANFRDGEFLNALSTKGVFSYIYQALPILFLVKYKQKVIITEVENIFYNITFISLLTLTLALELRIMLRVEYYFLIAKVFTLPLLIRLFNTSRSRTIVVLVLALYFSLYFAAIYITGVEKHILPYKNIFGIEVY
ncbi:EpsG family protein [Salmonella enterica]